MLSQSDRQNLENQVLSATLIFENFFLRVYDFNPTPEDLFLSSLNREIYLAATEYYVDKGYPTLPDVFTQLILKNSSEEIKSHFTKSISTAEPSADFSIVQRLIEDSIEVRTRETIKLFDKKRVTGLEYAESLRESIDNIILNRFDNYKKDHRTNEQKVYELLNSIQQIKEGKGSDYIPTGFQKIDEAIIGLPKSHLTTIASRPGMGKTSLMLQLKRNLVSQNYKPLIISIEMTSDQLLIKDISAYSQIDSRKIESGNINNHENSLISAASKIICRDDYFIEDDSMWTVEKIKSTIRRHLIKNKIDCVFIDYLTLIRTNSRKDRYDLAVGEMTNSLREFAKETGLPIIILSQLNRDSEKRTEKRPVLSDLKESGSIEQDSKTVMFLFRPGYYGIDSKESSSWITKENEAVRNEEYSEVIIAKARSGKTGIVPLRYKKEHHLFEDLYRSEFNNHSNKSNSIKSYYEKEEEVF